MKNDGAYRPPPVEKAERPKAPPMAPNRNIPTLDLGHYGKPVLCLKYLKEDFCPTTGSYFPSADLDVIVDRRSPVEWKEIARSLLNEIGE